MSVRVMTDVFATTLEPLDKLLLLALAWYADDEGDHVFPSIKSLSEKTSMAERTVQYHLRRLRARGLVATTSLGSGRRTTRYRISLATLQGCMPCVTPPRPVHLRGAPTGTSGVHIVHPSGAPACTQSVKDPSVDPSRIRQLAKSVFKPLSHPDQDRFARSVPDAAATRRMLRDRGL